MKNVQTILLTMIITAVIIGGGIYLLQNSKSQSAEQNLQKQIIDLQDQIRQFQQVQQNLQQDGQPVIKQDQNVNQQVNQSQEIFYNNSKYQFSLKFPVAWEGYKVSEPGNGGTICFSVPASGSQPFCIFQLYILSENEVMPSALKLVGQTNNWKITADKNIGCTQLNSFQCERAKEVSEILKTFTVTE